MDIWAQTQSQVEEISYSDRTHNRAAAHIKKEPIKMLQVSGLHPGPRREEGGLDIPA